MLDASDRPLLCCSLQGREVVVGGADHALYCYDAATGRPTRRLYGQRHGHIDWYVDVLIQWDLSTAGTILFSL